MSDTPELPGAPHAKAVEKLAEIAELLLKPWAIKRQARAEAYKIVTVAKAEIAAADLHDRARRRAECDEIRHQENLEAILGQARVVMENRDAQKLLPEKASVGASDPDWFHKWASYAKETSDEDIRALWAKVLAGEIIEPGKFSLRLLQTISLLRKSEAQSFQLLANYVVKNEDDRLLFLDTHRAAKWLRETCGIDERFFISLENLGLIRRPHEVEGTPQRMFSTRVMYGGSVYTLKFIGIPGSGISLRPRELTEIGHELYGLCDVQPDKEYAELLFKKIFCTDNSHWTVLIEP